jgi:hypothetical protein
MDIRGIDVFFRVAREGVTFGDFASILLAHWPDAFYQSAEEDEIYPLRSVTRDVGSEWFVYRDRGAAETWGRLGYSDECANQMIHFLTSPAPAGGSRITMVYDKSSDEMDQIRREITTRLAEHEK